MSRLSGSKPRSGFLTPTLARLTWIAAAAFVAAAPVHAAAALDADSLYRRALVHLARNTPDHRRLALDDLTLATRLAPTRTDLLSELAGAYALSGHRDQARRCYDRITRLTPDDARAQLRLGALWKREWLASFDTATYGKTARTLLRSAQLDRSLLEPRLELAGLALAHRSLDLAADAAYSAILCDPRSPEATLALACALHLDGQLGPADSVFRVSILQLPDAERRRFSDLAAIAWDAVAVTPGRAAAADSFWHAHDPDLTTRENEAQLEFWARIGTALLLFRDSGGLRWDVRSELVARYGIPARIMMSPPPGIDSDVFSDRSFSVGRFAGNEYAPAPVSYPYQLQTWVYPDLGLSIPIWDRSLRDDYVFPVGITEDTDLKPDPELLASRPDLVALGGGLGVFRVMAPGVRVLPVRAALAQLPSDRGALILAHLDAPGQPTETLTGTWVMVDSRGAEVARASGVLSSSACEPEERRIAQFHADVPPGEYRVDLAVDDGHGRRGLLHLKTRVEPPPAGLTVGDLVLLCGPSGGYAGEGAIRLEPNFDHRLHHARVVTAYFEADHLALDAGGRARFSYRYLVRPVRPDVRPDVRRELTVDATREEENVGARRRQFVSVPIGTLPPAEYELVVEVRDLQSGAVVVRSARFVKD